MAPAEATLSSPGKAVLPPSSLAHVVLQTANYSTLVEYYKTFLGARVAFANDSITLLRYDEEHHRIGILNVPHLVRPKDLPNSSGVTGLSHVAFTYPSLEALCMAWSQRRENGIEPSWCVNHGPTTSAYYRDPDGNMIETQCDNMDSAEAEKYMESEEFLTNPIGTDFNMEDLIERLKSGEKEEVLMKRKEIGSRGLETVPIL